MNGKILLVTKNDDAYRQPLLQAQGYYVVMSDLSGVFETLRTDNFQAALVTTEIGLDDTLVLCEELKRHDPNLRVGILAQELEFIPKGSCADIVIRPQFSPAKFLESVATIMGAEPSQHKG